MDLAYVDKLAKENNDVKFLLVRQDLFDRTVDAKGMKIKDSQETVKALSSMNSKKNRPNEIWLDKGTVFAGVLTKFCIADGTQVYSTMNETKAALLNVQYDHWKMFFTVTWKILYTSKYTNYPNLLQP